MSKYTIADKEAKELDPKVWAEESFEISENFVYKGKSPLLFPLRYLTLWDYFQETLH